MLLLGTAQKCPEVGWAVIPLVSDQVETLCPQSCPAPSTLGQVYGPGVPLQVWSPPLGARGTCRQERPLQVLLGDWEAIVGDSHLLPPQELRLHNPPPYTRVAVSGSSQV